jgi:hypothetical protein
MASNGNSVAIQELLKRTTRIESRLVKLAEGMDIPVKLPPTIRAQVSSVGECQVIIDDMEVPISSIVEACQKRGAVDTWAAVHCGGQWVAQVFIP